MKEALRALPRELAQRVAGYDWRQVFNVLQAVGRVLLSAATPCGHLMFEGQSSEVVFGAPDPARSYRPRRAAYAVITDEEGRVASVRARYGYFLPGGGSRMGETPAQTIEREVMEELGQGVRIVRLIGQAIQYFSAEDGSYRMEATFYAAEFSGEAGGHRPEHELYWMARDEMAGLLYHQCHAWAVDEERRTKE